MEREIKNATRNQVKQDAFDALIEKNEFEVPKAMLEQEIDRQRDQMLQRFAQQFGADPKTFDKSMFPNEMFEEQALRAARLGVIVASIITMKILLRSSNSLPMTKNNVQALNL